jgi:2-keto-3-deoxy-L-rhamnonate aldolase RhmA
VKCALKEKLAKGDVCVGTWVTIGHPDVPDIFEAMGFEWLIFDGEHAPLGPESLSGMIQAIDPDRICPIVRIGAAEQYMVKAALDMGAHGIICPLVNTAEDAEKVVSFAKYPPVGVRGVAPRKAADYGLSFKEYLRTANDQTLVVAQIETKEALGNLEGILSTQGVDVAFVGPSDLTMSLGLYDDRSNPKVIEAMKTVIERCKHHGKTPGVLAATPEEVKRAVSLGFKFIGLGSDTRFMIGGAKTYLEAAGRS